MTQDENVNSPVDTGSCGCGPETPGVRYPVMINCDDSRLWIESCDQCSRYEGDEAAAAALVNAGVIPAFALARASDCRSFTPYATDERGIPLLSADGEGELSIRISEGMYRAICGLVQPSSDVDPAEVIAEDEDWERLRAHFPIHDARIAD